MFNFKNATLQKMSANYLLVHFKMIFTVPGMYELTIQILKYLLIRDAPDTGTGWAVYPAGLISGNSESRLPDIWCGRIPDIQPDFDLVSFKYTRPQMS
jgi:hypothetical protein